MALSDTTNSTDAEKPVIETGRHEKREKPPTKVIIRRLPPSITQEDFLTQVSPIPDYDYIYTIKGDMSLGENSFSRVYINFVKSEDIYLFREKFDNYVFVDAKGHEYAAVVEFASFQKIPKKRGKPRPDPKIGTIENDPIYLEFLESLKQQPNQEEKPEFSYQPSNESKNESSTPLLDYIKQRKIDKLKSKEEKREERRKREIERKKLREEDRRRRFEEKSPSKHISVKASSQSKSDVVSTDKDSEKTEMKTIKEEDLEKEQKAEKSEKSNEKQSSSTHKGKDVKKYDDYKSSSTKYKQKHAGRSEKYDTFEKRDYKPRRDDYRDRERRGRYDDHKKDDHKKEGDAKQFTKKVKKYSERREERKYEIKKAEQKKDDSMPADDNKESKGDETSLSSKPKQSSPERSASEENREIKNKEEFHRSSSKEGDGNKSDDQDKMRNKENDPRLQRRIRNKDRPTMQLYQPGMLSKRRHQEDDKEPTKETIVKD